MQNNIRKANEHDIESITNLMIKGINETSIYSSGDINKIESWDSNTVYLKDALANNSIYIYVAIQDDKVVGVIIAYTIPIPEVPFFTKNKRIYIEALDVDNKFRSQGIGTSLIQKIEEIAKSDDVHGIELEVYSNNSKADKLYESLGYNEIKKRRRKRI
jgi:ribosomal protein S18 acetylase RimI-like enzyme